MTDLVHLDGELVPADQACVNVRDRGFLYGDALFETLRAYGGEVFEWAAHWERFRRGSDRIALDHGYDERDIVGRIEDTLAANDLADAYVRLSVTRGRQSGRLTPTAASDPTVVILVEPLPRGGIDGTPVWEAPASCTIADTEHVPDEALPSHLKTHNYLNGILAKLEARERATDEALLLDGDGFLTEGTTTNVFFVEGGVVHTPGLADGPVLPGVTRQVVIDLAETIDVPVRTGRWTADDLADAEEVFVTNTTWEVRPVSAVDGMCFDVGPVATELGAAFDELVESGHYRP